MKTLLIGPLPNPIDGCSLSNDTLCKNLQKQHIEYNTINTNVKSVSSNQGSSFSLKKALVFLKVYFKIFRILKANVIYLTPGQTFFGVLKYSPFIFLCQLLKKPYVIHVHGNHLGTEYKELTGIKKKIFKSLIKKASAGIVLSTSLRDNFNNLLPDDKVFEVENFANDELYKNYNPSQKNKEIPTILFLSNLIAEKGVLDLLDALVVLKEKEVKFKVFLAGKIEEDYKEVINDKIKEIGSQVEYLGVIRGEAKIKYLNESNIFILPTYYTMEGQPISILEAMAMGNIVITTKHAGIPDVFSEENGFYVDRKSPQQIANVIEKISFKTEEYVSNFSKFNFSYAKNKFTENIFSNKIIEILKSVAQ